ncbi:MAG: hypothetical protein IKG82_16410 [Oscillospiraceae bacterium]|nr:hypothetical protein [Oscillospiraceae bacterium]
MLSEEELMLQISNLDDEIEKLKEQRDKFQDELDDYKKRKATELTLSLVDEVDGDNSKVEHLFPDSSTTPIMDSFYNSKYKFLIIDDAYKIGFRKTQQTSSGLKESKGYAIVSLIVIKRNSLKGTVYVKKTGLTMTDLKMSINSNSFYPRNQEKRERLSALAEELLRLDLGLYEKGICVPFQNICYLGAQIYKNQTGYGSEYCGEELVHQGTLYGETTGFFIIGVRIEFSWTD